MSDSIPELRLKSILLYLANATTVITIKQIADEIGVSRRTILRDMQEVEKWLTANGFELYKKSGHGVMLIGDESVRERLADMLNEKVPEVVNIPKDRQKMLLVELLQKKEPVKLYYYTSKFGVSVSTISNDLDKVEGWLNKYNLLLVRKTGLGVYVSGQEKDFRRAMISLLYENLSEEELMRLIKDTVPIMQKKENILQVNVRNRLLNLIDRSSIEKIENIIYKLEKTLPYKLVESARIGLMVHLALAIQRIKNNEKISINAALLEQLKKISEYLFAEDIAKEVSEQFNIEIPEDEIGYITMHLNGARVYNGTLKEENLAEKKDLVDIVNEMINTVEKEFGVKLGEDEKLLYDLVCHLDPALRRLEMELDIRNPLLDKLKQLFPDIYRISERAAEVLKTRTSAEIPESEIGFLAMHFGAAVEKNKLEMKRNFRVVVACPSGIGSSRLLSARLEKEFKDLEIIDILSTSEISREYVEENDIDLVVSTIPIENCPVENICVNPLLLEEDKFLLHQIIYKSEKSDRRPDVSGISIAQLKNNINQVVDYSNFISEILQRYYLFTNTDITYIERFASEVSRTITDDENIQAAIVDGLRNKNELVMTDDCIVINCYIKEVNESSLVLCRLNKKLIFELSKKSCNLAVLLIIPEKRRNTHKSIIKDFNTFISNNQLVIKHSYSEEQDEIKEKLHRALSELYMSKLYEWRTELLS